MRQREWLRARSARSYGEPLVDQFSDWVAERFWGAAGTVVVLAIIIVAAFYLVAAIEALARAIGL